MISERRRRLLGVGAALLAVLTACQAEPAVVSTPTSAEELLAERAAGVVTPIPVLPTPTAMPSPTPSAAPTPTVRPDPSPTPRPAPTSAFVSSVEGVSCDVVGLREDPIDGMDLLVQLTGPDRLADASLNVDLRRHDGDSIGRTTIHVPGVAPNEEVAMMDFTYLDPPDGVAWESIECVPRELEWRDPIRPVDHSLQCVPSLNADGEAAVRISSAFEAPIGLARTVNVWFAVRAGADVRIADGLVIVYGAAGRVEIDMAGRALHRLPDGIDADDMVCSVVLVEVSTLLFDRSVEELPGPTTCEILGVDDLGRVQVQVSADIPDIEDRGQNLTWTAHAPDGVMVMSGKRGIEAGGNPDGVYVLDSWEEPPEWLDLDDVECRVAGVDARY